MTQLMPVRFQNVELWATQYLAPLLSGVKVGRRKSTSTSSYREVVVQALPGVQLTPITQQVLLNVKCWAVKDNGSYDASASFNLAEDVAFHILSAPSSNRPFTDASRNAGPYFESDDSDVEYSLVTLALEVIRS